MPPAALAVRVIMRRRVTVSPSNAPGMPRSRVYLLLGSLRPSAMVRAENNIDGGAPLGAPWHTGRAVWSACGHGGAQRCGSVGLAGARGGLRGRMLGRRAVADRGRAGLPDGARA